jgi:hypothetical protein
MNVETNVSFILSHFDESSLFPRKMMTKHKNYQFTVYDKAELIQKCLESDLCDCRVNGYPILDKQELVSYPPNFIFIDMDLSNFMKYKSPQKMIETTLKNTLKNITTSFFIEPSQHTQHSPLEKGYDTQGPNLGFGTVVKPTVLWSGNGYHIYLPIQGLILDNFEPFSKEKYPNLFSGYNGKYIGYSVSELFLLFAVNYLASGKADPQHRPRYKTCLIRIPNTLNSKCLTKGLSKEESKVKIIQEWNGYRPPIQLLTKEFRRWLVQEEINQKIQNKKIRNTRSIKFSNTSNFQIQWIERLLQTGIPDGRKETLRLILAPYLIKRKSYEESIHILERWLDECNKVNPLGSGFDSKQRISNSLKNTKGYLKFDNLKLTYRWLYDILSKSINN